MNDKQGFTGQGQAVWLSLPCWQNGGLEAQTWGMKHPWKWTLPTRTLPSPPKPSPLAPELPTAWPAPTPLPRSQRP